MLIWRVSYFLLRRPCHCLSHSYVRYLIRTLYTSCRTAPGLFQHAEVFSKSGKERIPLMFIRSFSASKQSCYQSCGSRMRPCYTRTLILFFELFTNEWYLKWNESATAWLRISRRYTIILVPVICSSRMQLSVTAPCLILLQDVEMTLRNTTTRL